MELSQNVTFIKNEFSDWEDDLNKVKTIDSMFKGAYKAEVNIFKKMKKANTYRKIP